ncbi:MAG: hypothetical protein KKA78_12910 [Alphaproteobacteria bacterium]|nr:hypothetical protein [Alphaproteobacteria bacterium]
MARRAGDESVETFVGFAAAHCDPSVFFQLSKEVLDQVPPFVSVDMLMLEFGWRGCWIIFLPREKMRRELIDLEDYSPEPKVSS